MRTLATQKCDTNYGNCPDMINASLTDRAGGVFRGKPKGCLDTSVCGMIVTGRGHRPISRHNPGPEADMDRVDCVVIGAGVIGLAVARKLALAGREVIVLEAAEGIGTVTSSRKREV